MKEGAELIVGKNTDVNVGECVQVLDGKLLIGKVDVKKDMEKLI